VYLGGRSGLHAFLIIFGLCFVPILTFVYLSRTTDEGRPTDDQPADNDDGRPTDDPARAEIACPSSVVRRPSSRWLAVLPLALLLAGLAVGFPLLLLAGLGLLASEQALRLAHRPGESFALLLAALGCAVLFGVEIIYIRDVFEGLSARMNTVFKFYYQVWLLWGTLAPFALWWCLRYATKRARPIAWGAAALTVALLAGAMVYPWLTLRELGRGKLVGLTQPTPRELTPAGAASVEWLRQAVAPGSVVLEAVMLEDVKVPRCGGSYNGDGYGGIAAATGLPTVLGWLGHQQQWRGGDPAVLAQLGPRCADVDTIYSTTDTATARRLLAKYGVAYVYVGSLEQRVYGAESLDKFSALGEMVFQQDEVTIFKLR
jgi:YYY domain-containing protein